MARPTRSRLRAILRGHWRMLSSFMLLSMALLVTVLGWANWLEETRPPTLEEAFPTGELRVGVDTSFAPFAVDRDGTLVGLDIDLAQAIGDEIGIPVRFVPLGFDGLYDALITGQVDVLISALVVNPVRMDEVRYTRHYYDSGLLLVAEADTEITGFRALPSHSLAFEFGSIANAEARRWSRRLPDFEMRPYELPRYALDAVRLGEADVALVNATTYDLYRREYPSWQGEAHRYSNSFYAAAVRLDREATWIWINAVMNRVYGDGRLQTIIDRWL